MFLKLPFAVSFSVLFITIQYAVFRKSLRTFYIYIYMYIIAMTRKCENKVLNIANVDLK